MARRRVRTVPIIPWTAKGKGKGKGKTAKRSTASGDSEDSEEEDEGAADTTALPSVGDSVRFRFHAGGASFRAGSEVGKVVRITARTFFVKINDSVDIGKQHKDNTLAVSKVSGISAATRCRDWSSESTSAMWDFVGRRGYGDKRRGGSSGAAGVATSAAAAAYAAASSDDEQYSMSCASEVPTSSGSHTCPT